jgi:hypothetical protein
MTEPKRVRRPQIVREPVHVPGHLIPHKCSMCKREIVRVPTTAGIVHVDYPVRMGQGLNYGRLYGDAHDCVATRPATSR